MEATGLGHPEFCLAGEMLAQTVLPGRVRLAQVLGRFLLTFLIPPPRQLRVQAEEVAA